MRKANPDKKPRTNPVARINGLKGGRPQTENLLAGFVDLDTGKPGEFRPSPYFPSMKAAALSMGIEIAILKDARMRDCPAFRSSGAVHRSQLMEWLKKNVTPENLHTGKPEIGADTLGPESDDFIDNYDIADEAGGVGQTLKSLQAYERRAKKKLDLLEKDKSMHPAIKGEVVKAAMDAWIKVVNALLKYDLSVSQAKRESGELIPISDAQEGVQGLLAWHTIATSEALRNIIPNLEGKNKFEIAALLDPAIRAAIYRNFKLGFELGKIPEWMAKTATEHVKAEKPLNLKPTLDLSGY